MSSTNTIRTLTFRSYIDTKGFDSGIVALEGKTGQLTRGIGTQIGDLTPAFDKLNKGFEGSTSKLAATSAEAMGGGGAFDAQGAQMAASIDRLAPKISASLQSALAPIGNMVKGLGSTLSKQLDAQLKFQKFRTSIDDVRAFYDGSLDKMGDKAKGFRNQIQKVTGNAALRQSSPIKAKTFDAGASAKADFKPAAISLGIFGGAAEKASGSVKSLGIQIAAAFGFVGLIYKVASVAKMFFSSGIKGASDLNETVSKTKQVLGDASPAVEKYADTMASKFGIAKGETLDLASGLGGLAKGLGGLKGDQLAGFTTQFTTLAADLSSFKNIDLKTAGDALRIGLSGEQSDQLKALGVVMTEDTVKAKAYALGIAQVGDKLTETQKFAARAAVIQSALGKLGATGDLERTADGTANQYRKLTGTITNLATSVGTVLLPVVNTGIGVIGQLVGKAGAAFENNKGMITAVMDAIVDKIDFVSAVVSNFPAAFEVARLKILEVMTNVGEYFAVLGPNAIVVAKYIGDNWLLLIGDAFDATLTGLKNLWSNWQAIGTAIGEWFANPAGGFHVNWTPLLDGFKATAEKFPTLLKPALTDMSKEIAEAGKPITDDYAAKRAKRADDALKTSSPAAAMADEAVPEAGTEKAKKGSKGEVKLLAGAQEIGTTEAYSSIVKAIAGSKSGSVQDKQLDQQKRSNGILTRIEKGVTGKKPAVANF